MIIDCLAIDVLADKRFARIRILIVINSDVGGATVPNFIRLSAILTGIRDVFDVTLTGDLCIKVLFSSISALVRVEAVQLIGLDINPRKLQPEIN